MTASKTIARFFCLRLEQSRFAVDTISMKNLLFVVLFGLVFGAGSAWANGVVTSDVLMQLNNSVFASPEFTLTPLLSGHEIIPVPDMVVPSQVPVSLSGISVEASWQLNPPSNPLAIGADFPLASKSLDVRLLIQKLSVDAWVDTQVGGVTVHAHVLGECDRIPLALTGAAQLSGVVRTGVDGGGLPAVQLMSVRAQWPASAWSVGEFNCGVGGDSFRSKVMTGLLAYFASPPPSLNDQLKTAIGSRLASFQDQLRAWFLQPRTLASGLQGVNLTLRPRAIAAVRSDGLQVAGQVDFNFASSASAPTATVSANGSGPALSATGFQMAFPEGLPAALAAMAYQLGYFQLRQSGSQIQGFQDFLANPFLKLFIWPQLEFYSQQDPFYFDFSLSESPRFGSIVSSAGGGDGGITGQVAGTLGLLMWAPDSSAFVKMLRFSVPLTTTYQWTMSAAGGGGGGSDVQISLSGTQIALNASWEPDYYSSHLVNPYIALDVLKGQFVTWVEGQSWKFHLPALQLTSTTSLSFSSVQNSGGWLSFGLTP